MVAQPELVPAAESHAVGQLSADARLGWCIDAAAQPHAASFMIEDFAGGRAVRAARKHARAILGEEHPCAEDAELVVSELVTNAYSYGFAGAGCVTVSVLSMFGVLAYVAVDDPGGSGTSRPHVAPLSDGSESYRGLLLVEQCSAWWGSAPRAGGWHVAAVLRPDTDALKPNGGDPAWLQPAPPAGWLSDTPGAPTGALAAAPSPDGEDG